jgi:hypothetical protein
MLQLYFIVHKFVNLLRLYIVANSTLQKTVSTFVFQLEPSSPEEQYSKVLSSGICPLKFRRHFISKIRVTFSGLHGHIPGETTLHIRLCENIKSGVVIIIFQRNLLQVYPGITVGYNLYNCHFLSSII